LLLSRSAKQGGDAMIYLIIPMIYVAMTAATVVRMAFRTN
jgi:hypothetical protein